MHKLPKHGERCMKVLSGTISLWIRVRSNWKVRLLGRDRLWTSWIIKGSLKWGSWNQLRW